MIVSKDLIYSIRSLLLAEDCVLHNGTREIPCLVSRNVLVTLFNHFFVHALICLHCNTAKHQRHFMDVSSVDIISVNVWPPVKLGHQKTKRQMMTLIDEVKIN